MWEQLSAQRTAEILAARKAVDVQIPDDVNEEAGTRYIPQGPFLAGDHREDWFRDELPKEIHLRAYWIDTYPVTNAEYEKFVKATEHPIPPHWTSGSYQKDQADHPVTNVSWDDASAYAAWVGKRLPTEAEWEKAARGTDGRIYPWGDTYWKDLCNGCNDYGGTTPVNRFEGLSPYGVADMCGNVFDWVSDWYQDGYSSTVTNPKGPDTGEVRSMRGGFYGAGQRHLRSAYRGWAPQTNKQDHIGFRCATFPSKSGSTQPTQKNKNGGLTNDQLEKVGTLHQNLAPLMRQAHVVRNGHGTHVKLAFVDQTIFGEVVDSSWPTGNAYQFTLSPPDVECILDYSLPVRNGILKQLGLGQEREVGDAILTMEERRLLTTAVRQDLAHLEQVWDPVENRSVKNAEIEQDKRNLNIVEPGDTVILVAMEYELHDIAKGLINIVYPLPAIQSVIDRM